MGKTVGSTMMLLLSVPSFALQFPQASDAEDVVMLRQQPTPAPTKNLTCPAWCLASTESWTNLCSWSGGCEVCTPCPSCTTGYKTPSTLEMIQEAVEPMMSSVYGGSCADGNGGVKNCYSAENLTVMNANCTAANNSITALRAVGQDAKNRSLSDIDQYSSSKIKKCKDSLGEIVFCTAGDAA